jgi:hypothetical protein
MGAPRRRLRRPRHDLLADMTRQREAFADGFKIDYDPSLIEFNEKMTTPMPKLRLSR